MRAREFIYYMVTGMVGVRLPERKTVSLFSAFSFPRDGAALDERRISNWLRSPGLYIGLFSLLALLGVNAVWSALRGRFLPDAGVTTRNFLEDWPNLINYSLLCPLYVVFGTYFVTHIGGLRNALTRSGLLPALGVADELPTRSGKKWALSVGLIVLSSMLSISFYASELPNYRWLFWFQSISAHGDRILTAHGYYYILTNIFLNLLMVAVVATHFEMFAVSWIVGKGIRKLMTEKKPLPESLTSPDDLLRLFKPFTSLYVASKVLVVVVLVNMYTWKAQEPDFRGMLEFTIVFLALMGAAVVSYPRYHVHYWLYRAREQAKPSEYPETRYPWAVGLADFADLLILGGAMTNLLAYVLTKSGVNIKLF
jgi:hypothetical protein